MRLLQGFNECRYNDLRCNPRLAQSSDFVEGLAHTPQRHLGAELTRQFEWRVAYCACVAVAL